MHGEGHAQPLPSGRVRPRSPRGVLRTAWRACVRHVSAPRCQDHEPGASAPAERGPARRKGRRSLHLPHQQSALAGSAASPPRVRGPWRARAGAHCAHLYRSQVMEDYGLEFLYNSGALLTRLIGDPPKVPPPARVMFPLQCWGATPRPRRAARPQGTDAATGRVGCGPSARVLERACRQGALHAASTQTVCGGHVPCEKSVRCLR
jgi:hypothetical protein